MKLPIPSNSALDHSQKVADYVTDKIQQSDISIGSTKAIPFSQYMEHVLYAPGLGYYSAGCIKFGEQGDFVTAPEISPLFSRCIARAITPVLTQLSESNILEVGAGSGKMAAAILNELAATEINIACYYILERSAELRQRQQHTIAAIAPELLDKVQWLDSLPEIFSGVVVANELLDAMPVQRFKKKNNSVVEMHVGIENDQFVWLEVDASNSRLASRISKIENSIGIHFQENYQSEINFVAEDWLSSINAILEKGYILIIDYGYPESEYYHEQRSEGTLSCFYQHRWHNDPFLYLGLQDLTAHIDFSNLTDAVLNDDRNIEVNTSDDPTSGHKFSLQLNGYTTQSQFLMASGLMDMMQDTTDVKQQLIVSQEIKKLTMPYEMGETVKVIGFEKGMSDSESHDFELACFSMRDLRYQL